MENMNTGPQLTPKEQEMFNSFVEKNPGMTPADFLELRNLALQSSNPGSHKFFEAGGIVMEDQPNSDELKEIRTIN